MRLSFFLDVKLLDFNNITWLLAAVFIYSPSLTSALEDIAKHIPSLRREIKDGLLQMLSLILTGRPPPPSGSARLAFQSAGR